MHQQQQVFQSIQITLTRSPFCGFGFAISNESTKTKDDRHLLIVSDVIKNGPADGKLLTDDRIIEVNGQPVVCQLEENALKLIRQSTDFLHLTIERRKCSMNKSLPIELIFDRTKDEQKFGIVLSCEYYLQKVPSNQNGTLNVGDEIVRINDIPIENLTLEQAQRLIDSSNDQIVVQTKSRRKEKTKKTNFHSNYFPHHFVGEEKRKISFFTDESNIGIRLVGGNKFGLFIGEIQKKSLAEKTGLVVADKIFKVNEFDFTKLTREEAVLHLMTMKSCQVTMIVANLPREFEILLNDVGGDSFYVRSHFALNPIEENQQIPIRINDVFHITNTLHNDQVGSWTGRKVNTKQSIIGVLPNENRAEQLSNVAMTLDQLMKMTRQKSLKNKFKSSKSISTLNRLKDESIFNKISSWKPTINSKFSSYERVELRPVTFIRPVVLLGSLADVARDRLLDEFADQFELPDVHIENSGKQQKEMIKLKSLDNIIRKNRHCLLEITPSAIEQLNYAQCFPIVVFFKFVDRRQIKEIREKFGKIYQKSSRLLFDLAERLETFYSYLFTSIIEIDSTTTNWIKILKNQIDFHQEQSIWMSKDFSMGEHFLQSDEFFLLTKFDASEEIFRENFKRIDSNSSTFPRENVTTALSNDRFHRRIPVEFLSNRTKSRDKSTMTENTQRSTPDLLYATWNCESKSNSSVRPTILQHRCFVRPDLLNPSMEKSRFNRKECLPDQNISTSSSSSSIRSVKLSNIHEFVDNRSFSGDDGDIRIGGARALIDSNGGKLFCSSTGISLTIPKGALREGIEKEIYFEIYQNISNVQQSNPTIICGPPGVQFDQPVKLILPHSTDHDVDQTSLFIDGVHYYNQNHSTMTKNGSNHYKSTNKSFLVNHF